MRRKHNSNALCFCQTDLSYIKMIGKGFSHVTSRLHLVTSELFEIVGLVYGRTTSINCAVVWDVAIKKHTYACNLFDIQRRCKLVSRPIAVSLPTA